MLNVKIKKLNKNAVIPNYAHDSDAGLDLTAISKFYDEYGNAVYGTGLAFAIPKNHVGYLFPRSSVSKKDLLLANSVGVIDSGYRGEVIFKFKRNMNVDKFENAIKTSDKFITLDGYKVGEKIGQIVIMPIPKINLIECDDLGVSDRGVGGFGSTDPITAAIEGNYSAE